jgi:tetratricopeptide (TPR) repeat protein
MGEMKMYDDAVVELKKILSLDPRNLNAFLNMAFIYVKQEKLTEAARVYEEVLSFDQTRAEIFSELGNIYIQAKDYSKAEEVIGKGLLLFTNNDELNFARSVLYEKTGRFDQMVSSLKRTIEINPKHADALNYLGYSYADKGINLEEALSLIQRALELKPDSGYILDSLGWVYFRLGKNEEALKQMKRALDTVKDDPVVYEHLGDIYEAAGENKDALEAWDNSLKYQAKEDGLKERVQKKISKLKKKYKL